MLSNFPINSQIEGFHIYMKSAIRNAQEVVEIKQAGNKRHKNETGIKL